jgi:hypothetical protein
MLASLSIIVKNRQLGRQARTARPSSLTSTEHPNNITMPAPGTPSPFFTDAFDGLPDCSFRHSLYEINHLLVFFEVSARNESRGLKDRELSVDRKAIIGQQGRALLSTRQHPPMKQSKGTRLRE